MELNAKSPKINALEVLTAALILAFGVILILLGGVIEGGPGEVAKEAGFVVIGTVLVAFVYELVLRRKHDRYVLRLVEDSLVSKGPFYGLKGFEDRLDFRELFERLRSGDELLWLDTYCPDQPNFQEALRVAVERGAKVRMLAVDPDSDVAKLRACEIRRDLGYSHNRFREEARGQVEHLVEALADAPAAALRRVRLRFYDDLPCAPIYIHVRHGRPLVAFSSYFLTDPTFSQPHLRWEASPAGFLVKFYDYFNAKWDAHAGREVTLGVSASKPHGRGAGPVETPQPVKSQATRPDDNAD